MQPPSDYQYFIQEMEAESRLDQGRCEVCTQFRRLNMEGVCKTCSNERDHPFDLIATLKPTE